MRTIEENTKSRWLACDFNSSSAMWTFRRNLWFLQQRCCLEPSGRLRQFWRPCFLRHLRISHHTTPFEGDGKNGNNLAQTVLHAQSFPYFPSIIFSHSHRHRHVLSRRNSLKPL